MKAYPYITRITVEQFTQHKNFMFENEQARCYESCLNPIIRTIDTNIIFTRVEHESPKLYIDALPWLADLKPITPEDYNDFGMAFVERELINLNK